MAELKFTLVVFLTLLYVHSSTGDREWILETDYDRSDITHFGHTIFPRIQVCRREKEERIGETRKTRPVLWSNVVNDYLFFSPHLLSPDAQKFFSSVFLTDSHYLPVYFGVLILILLIIIFGILSIFVVSAIGMIIFLAFFYVYKLATCNRVRTSLRYLAIQSELARRKREDYLITASHVRRKPPKRRYHMIKFLRDHTDEEIPDELIENEDERIEKYKITEHNTSSSDPDDDDESVEEEEKDPQHLHDTPAEMRRRLRIQKRRDTLKKELETVSRKKLKTRRATATLITNINT